MDTETRGRAGRGSPGTGRSRGGDRGSDVLITGQPPMEHNAAILNDLTKGGLTQENAWKEISLKIMISDCLLQPFMETGTY